MHENVRLPNRSWQDFARGSVSDRLEKLSNSPNVDQASEHASAALVCTLLCENPVGERWQRLTAKAYQRCGFGSEFPRPLLSAAVTRARTRLKCLDGGCHTPAETPASTTPLTHVSTPRTASSLHPRESARELGLTATQSSPQAACACPRPNAEIRGEGDRRCVRSSSDCRNDPTKFLDCQNEVGRRHATINQQLRRSRSNKKMIMKG